jgi:hypothetical protein
MINPEVYVFEGVDLQRVFDRLGYADSVLEGHSQLAVVTAVHPSDRFIITSSSWHEPRKFFVQARSGETGAHYRLGKPKITGFVRWVTGSVDLVMFDARTATFSGLALERVPLFLVNGLGRTAALFEAKLVAQAELFRLFEDDWGNALFNPALDCLAGATDPEQLASQLCDWPSTVGMEADDDVILHLLGLQEAAKREADMQACVARMLVDKHGGVSMEDLEGQDRFPNKLPDNGVSGKARVLQDNDLDPHLYNDGTTDEVRCRHARNDSGVPRTDYLLW